MSRLTAKQEKFVQGIVSGLSQRQAYLQAYPASRNWKETTVDNNAYKLMKNNEVLTRYNELIEEHSNKALWTREKATNALLWLVEQAQDDLKEQGFRQANSTAFLNAIKELNEIAVVLPLRESQINKADTETDFTKARTEQIKGATKDTSLLETLLKGQQQYEDMTKTGAFDKFGDADE